MVTMLKFFLLVFILPLSIADVVVDASIWERVWATLRDEQDSSLLSLVVGWVTHGRLCAGHTRRRHHSRESHLAEVEGHHAWHSTGDRLLGTIWISLRILTHHHLLLDELLLKILDLLVLVHHDGLIDKLLLLWSHLSHVGQGSATNLSRLSHHHWIWLAHSCKESHRIHLVLKASIRGMLLAGCLIVLLAILLVTLIIFFVLSGDIWFLWILSC